MISEEAKEWIERGESDFKIVEHELKLLEEEIVKDVVCFHCQQAIEKYLKAFLINHRIVYKKTHNIDYLIEECAKIDKNFQNIEVRNISHFGVKIRYPDDFYMPTIEEIKFYYDLTKKIKDLVFVKLGIKEEDLK